MTFPIQQRELSLVLMSQRNSKSITRCSVHLVLIPFYRADTMDHKTEAFECLERGMLAGAKMHFRHAVDDIWTNKKTEDKSAVLGELLRGYAEVLWRENLSEDALCQINCR